MKTIPAFMTALLLGGCQTLQAPAGYTSCVDNGTVFVNHTEALICYSNQLASLPPESLKTQLARQEKVNEYTRDSIEVLRLAILLSIPDTAIEDRNRAQGILADFLGNPGAADPGVIQFASLLRARLQAYDKLEQQVIAREQSLEASKRLADQLQSRIDSLRAIGKISEAEIAELRRQVDTLKSIDNLMDSRGFNVLR